MPRISLNGLIRMVLSFFLMALVAGNTQAESAKVDFSLPDIHGQERNISEFRGKWVVVNFWATWCPPCLQEMPELEMFHSAHKNLDAVVVGINLEDIGADQLREFVDEQFISYPILMGGEGVATPLGRVSSLPTTYLISPEGKAVARQIGALDRETLERFIVKFEKNATDRKKI